MDKIKETPKTPILTLTEKISILKTIKDKDLHDKLMMVLGNFEKYRKDSQKLFDFTNKSTADKLREIADDVETEFLNRDDK